MTIKILIIIFAGGTISFLLSMLIELINRKIGIDKSFRESESHVLEILSFVNGLIEFSLYALAFMFKAPQFVLFWLGVKTALRWFWKSPVSFQSSFSLKPINFEESEDLKPNVNETIKNENFTNKASYLKFLFGNSIVIICSYILASILNRGIIYFDNL